MSERGDVGPLAGFTIAITANRRRLEFGAALERRGARIVYAPAVRIGPAVEDARLREATRALLAAPVDVLVATTAVGVRGWVEAAQAWGMGDALAEHARHVELVGRGPKVVAALRAVLGGPVANRAWSPPVESSTEVLEHLLGQDLRGRRIAVQLHGEPLPDLVQALREAGADVCEISVFAWTPPADVGPLRRLVSATAAGQIDAVAFTSAPAVVSFLACAEADGLLDKVLAALRGRVLPACVGPVTAAPLQRRDVPVAQPHRSRLGALVREIADQVPSRCGQVVAAAGHRLEIRGHLVLIDGAPVMLAAGSMALLRMLARYPGRVVSRGVLLAGLPGESGDEHAVEVAVARLRASLGDSRTIQTVVKRGYRLAFEPDQAASCANDHVYI